MRDILLLGVRAVAAGALVLVFAAIGEALRPKRMSGLFAAAPSVALASLIVAAVSKGESQVASSAAGMIAGAVALVVCAVVAWQAVPRMHALMGSAVAVVAWFAAAGVAYALFLR